MRHALLLVLTFVLTLSVGLLGGGPTAALGEVLQIDFGKTGQAVQAGWQEFSGVTPGLASKSFAFGAGQVTITLKDSLSGPYWQNRVGTGTITSNSVLHPIGQVALDFVFGESYATFDMKLAGLAPGTYYARTYHHDVRTNYGTINVALSDALGSQTVAAGVPISFGGTGSEAGVTDPAPGLVSGVPIKIVVGLLGEAVVTFTPNQRYTHLGGLELTDELPEGLKVDFQVGPDGQTQEGFQPYSQPSTTNMYRPQSHWFFTDLGTRGSVRVELAPDSGPMSPRNRTNMTVPLGDLVEDFFAPAGGMTVRLDSLKAGRYRMTSYHHDASTSPRYPINISVSDAVAMNRTVITDLPQTYGPTPDPPASATFEFDANGLLPVDIRYTTSSGVIIQNGFALERVGEAPAPKPLKIYLLAGQSNADGRAVSAELPAEWKAPQLDVPTYHVGKWQALQPGLVAANPSYFGPELSFGRAMADGQEECIAIVKYATGGSTLYSDWRPGTGAGDPGGPQWQALVATVQAALASLGDDYQAEVAGMIWMQGEQDAYITDPAVAGAYEANLTNFIQRVRQLVDRPNMPFVIGQIIDYPTYAHADVVMQAQTNVAAAMHNVGLVVTSDLPLKPGDNHYNTQGMLTLGQRFAQQMQQIPEPGSLVLLLSAALVVLGRRRLGR